MKINKFAHYKNDVIENFKNKCNEIDAKSWSYELLKIEKALSVFNICASDLSSDELISFLEKKYQRKKKLLNENQSPSIVDLSYYEMFAPSKEEAFIQWRKVNDHRSKMSKQNMDKNPELALAPTLEYQIKKYGEKEGLKRYEEFNQRKKEKNKTTLDYWLKEGYTLEDAIKKRSEYQVHFSKEKCIEKYGLEEGIKIFNKRQEKWLNTLNSKTHEEKIIINMKKNIFSLEGYLLRGYDEKTAKSLLESRLLKRKSFFSNESIDFLKEYFDLDEWVYGSKGEWFLWDEELKKHFFYDFVNVKKKVIIEYHGSTFHPNKKVLNEQEWIEWRHPFTKETADQKYDFDQYKKRLALKHGFLIFEIYSNDSLDDKIKIIEEIKNAFGYNT